MARVTLTNLNKTFVDAQSKKEVTAVNNVNLEIHDGEFMVLVGPSGCGKTTTMRMIAGLEESTSGEIRIGDRVVNDVPPRDRNIAMVFQNYALYPHMSVYENMAFGLKLRMLPSMWWQMTHSAEARERKNDIDRRVRKAADTLGISHLLDRKPRALSGGQRQRVALGRAIVREPQVFLMDEPLSNLDAKLREQTRTELIRLHRDLGVTTIYVTHDQVEAMTMGQRIAVMKDGIMQQCDTPENLYRNPANLFVAGFLGTPSMNFVRSARIVKNGAAPLIEAPGLRLHLPEERANALNAYVGKEVVLGIRPVDIYDQAHAPARVSAQKNTAQVVVDVVEPLGSKSTVYLTAGPSTLVAEIDAETQARVGQPLEILVDAERAHVFDTETERAIV